MPDNSENTPIPSEAETQAWYAEYYERQGSDRNDLLTNPEVLFQSLAFDVANTRALSSLGLDRTTAKVLDVGCGAGTSLIGFLKLGFRAANLAGIDINSERLVVGQTELPSIDFRCESADRMSFGSDFFDVVFESTMFVQLTNEVLARGIASEMLRVTKPGGFIVLADWRYSKPGNPNYLGLSNRRIRSLFDVDGRTGWVAQKKGALVPPLGRRLSRHLPALYFAVRGVAPFAVGQVTTVLRKSPTT